MKETRLRGAIILTACVGLLAACGTTARFPTAATGGGLASNGDVATQGNGLGPPGSTGSAAGGQGTTAATVSGATAAGGSGGAGIGSGPGGTASANGGSGSGGGGGTGGGGRAGTNAASNPAHAPGVTANTITIGEDYEVDGAQANAALGANGITQGDTEGEEETMIAYLNQQGGIDGRKIVAVYHAINALSTAPADTQYQAECQQFEQDSHVFAIFDGENPITEQCAQQAGGVAIFDDLSVTSSRTLAEYPSYFEIDMLDLNRIVLNEAEALGAQGYFSPWSSTLSRTGTTKAKVGVLSYASSDYNYAIDDVLLPELSRLGYAPASSDVVGVTYPQSDADLSTVSSDVSSAVLRFRADGVDHVIIVDGTGDLTLLFLNNAESEHYFPRYGFNTQNGPEALESPGDIPAAQLNGAMGIGWNPILDLSAADDTDSGPYSNAARRACISLMTAHGYTFSSTNAESVALGICAELEFLKSAITAGGPVIDQATFIAGADRLGWWSGGGDTFGEYASAAQHDIGAYYRYYQWNGSCGCMLYASGNQTAVGEGET